MRITKEKLKKLYKEFNIEHFGNKLPDCYFKVNKMKNAFGTYDPWEATIRISKTHNITEDILKSTLLHEMVHVYQSIYVDKFRRLVIYNKNLSKKMHKKDRWHSHEFKEFKEYFKAKGIEI